MLAPMSNEISPVMFGFHRKRRVLLFFPPVINFLCTRQMSDYWQEDTGNKNNYTASQIIEFTWILYYMLKSYVSASTVVTYFISCELWF